MTTPKYVSALDAARLIDQPKRRTWYGRRDRLAMMLMLRCGLRVSECYKLRRCEVRDSGHMMTLQVRRGKATMGSTKKGGKKTVRPRDIPVPGDVVEALRSWLANDLPIDSVLLLPTRAGRQVHRVDAYKMIHRYAKAAGIDAVHPHMLRHTFASSALDDGFTLAEVGHLLGHATLRSTSVYLHPNPDKLALKMKEWNRGN